MRGILRNVELLKEKQLRQTEVSSAVIESERVNSKEILNFYQLFWIFIIGSVAGVLVETIFGLIVEHKITSRAGVLYGPFNPVYGFGAIFITLAIYKIKDKPVWVIFLASMLLGGIFEVVCSLFQEICYGTVSWEYSNTPFNIAGRTNLMFSIFWGALGSAWIKLGYPIIAKTIDWTPKYIMKSVTWFLAAFMIFNMTISSVAATRHRGRREGVPAQSKIDSFLDRHYSNEVMDRVYQNAKAIKK